MKSSTHNQKADSGAIFRRLLRFMGPYRKGLTISVICIILSSLFNSFGPFVLGRATDALAGLVTGGEPVYSEIRRFITIPPFIFCMHFSSISARLSLSGSPRKRSVT